MFARSLSYLGLMLLAVGALAKVPPEEAAKLGQELTPMGAETAGNAAGSIPPWTGGITTPPPGYSPGDHHPDPFPDDKILFTITAANMDSYADKLSEGQKALLKAYPDWQMNVYPTRRTAAYPQWVYQAAQRNAVNAELAPGGNGVENAAIGPPFPIPQNGLEVVWNHLLRWRGQVVTRENGQAVPTRGGDYTLIQLEELLDFPYAMRSATPASVNATNLVLKFRQRVLQPPRLAGEILLVHEPINQDLKQRQAWTYNPGQRRVRKAPHVAFDNPGTASDGQRTNDDFDMYNGSPERYDWKLIGKQELYIPYNAYRLHSDTLTPDDIVQAGHIDPALARYELHRVWVVEGTVKPSTSHIYARRVFYIDEDSWQIAVATMYDSRDQLWRVAEGHIINYYEVPVAWTTLEVIHDLENGRYMVMGMDNQAPMYRFDTEAREDEFTTGALRRLGRR